MSYIGKTQLKASDIKRFNVTGSTSATHTLSWVAPNEQSLIITINGVKQQEDAYSVSGVTLTLTSALVTTDKMEVVGIVDIGQIVVPGTGVILNEHISYSAAIAQSKLSLDITNSDINASAAIAQSKLSLDVTNSDVNASAAIADTKIALGTAIQAYDADTAKTDVSQTWSATQNLADQILQRPVIEDYAETVYAGGNSSTAVTLAETNGNVQTFTMTGNCTFTMPSGSGLQAGSSLTLILTQDGTGSRTGAFTSVLWAGGTAPTLTTTATTGIDILTFYTFNGGASPVWYGFAAGMDMS